MMDLFNKAKIKELEARCVRAEAMAKNQANDINRLEASELKLMGDIRQMDQLIFQMGQMDSWERQRPLFNSLQAHTNLRMREESNRIQSLLIPEMQKAYR